MTEINTTRNIINKLLYTSVGQKIISSIFGLAIALLFHRVCKNNCVVFFAPRVEDIQDKILYTGYVCDDSLKPHYKKNNIIYVTTGLNKEEGMLLFKEITKIAKNFPDYRFVMPVANKYLKTGSSIRDNMIFVEYIPDLSKKIQSCAAIITYGGYNTTMEVLKSSVPAIFVPRQDGQKLEQFVRCYVFEPYEFFKVLNNKEFHHLTDTLKEVLKTKPKKFTFNMDGAKNSANEIYKIHRKQY